VTQSNHKIIRFAISNSLSNHHWSRYTVHIRRDTSHSHATASREYVQRSDNSTVSNKHWSWLTNHLIIYALASIS